MILSFPHPLPDELFISVLGRYYDNYVIKNLASFNQKLFGSRTFSQSSIFPSRLSHFVNATHSIFPLTAEEIIQNLTQFQFYKNFISEGAASSLKQKMLSNGFENSTTIVGLNSSKLIFSKQLMYCPECYANDMAAYDQAYFHRTHQLPLPVCQKHNIKLQCYVPDVLSTNPQLPPILNDRTPLNFTYAENRNQLFKILLAMAVEMLEGKLQLNTNKINYQAQLYKLGFCRGSTLSHEKINTFINSIIHQSDLDELLKLTKETECVTTFYSDALYRPSKTVNALKYLFLNYIIQQATPNTAASKNIAQQGVCLNKLCEAFLRPNSVSTFIKYDPKLKLDIQFVKCHCGMVYKTYLKQRKDQTFALKKKIVTFGPAWESSLLNLFESKKTFYSIGKILGVTHQMAKRITQKLLAKSKEENKSKHFQALWCRALEENNFSVNKTRRNNGKVYKWLSKHENGWLRIQNNKHRNRPRNRQLRINWGKLDKQLSQIIQKNYSQLIRSNYSKTITKSLLLRTAKSFRSITKTKEILRLPSTMKFIEGVVEEKVDFQRRKLNNAVQRIAANDSILNRSRILTTAKIRKLEPELEQELSKVIGSQNTPICTEQLT